MHEGLTSHIAFDIDVKFPELSIQLMHIKATRLDMQKGGVTLRKEVRRISFVNTELQISNVNIFCFYLFILFYLFYLTFYFARNVTEYFEHY